VDSVVVFVSFLDIVILHLSADNAVGARDQLFPF
jgi:hypothetical protein